MDVGVDVASVGSARPTAAATESGGVSAAGLAPAGRSGRFASTAATTATDVARGRRSNGRFGIATGSAGMVVGVATSWMVTAANVGSSERATADFGVGVESAICVSLGARLVSVLTSCSVGVSSEGRSTSGRSTTAAISGRRGVRRRFNGESVGVDFMTTSVGGINRTRSGGNDRATSDGMVGTRRSVRAGMLVASVTRRMTSGIGTASTDFRSATFS